MSSQVKVKLPKLGLKPFDVDMINWKPFWDQFNASVHSSCISGLTLATENYGEAVKIIEERFGNKQILISKCFYAAVCVATINQIRKIYVWT